MKKRLLKMLNKATYKEYHEILIKNKFINEKYKPIKCKHCGCKKFKEGNYGYEECWGRLVVSEYDIFCKSCNKPVGHWAYGNYDSGFNQ